MEFPLLFALWLFAITHIDTVIVLTAFCTDDRYGGNEILVGHYVGFCFGMIGAVLGALIAAEALRESAFLLGIVPLGLGLWGVLRRDNSASLNERSAPGHVIGRIGIVTLTGIGLSGENIAVFVPFFLTLSRVELLVVSIVYLIAAGFVFLVAYLLARVSRDRFLPDWIERWAVPVSLILIGIYVLLVGWLAG